MWPERRTAIWLALPFIGSPKFGCTYAGSEFSKSFLRKERKTLENRSRQGLSSRKEFEKAKSRSQWVRDLGYFTFVRARTTLPARGF